MDRPGAGRHCIDPIDPQHTDWGQLLPSVMLRFVGALVVSIYAALHIIITRYLDCDCSFQTHQHILLNSPKPS